MAAATLRCEPTRSAGRLSLTPKPLGHLWAAETWFLARDPLLCPGKRGLRGREAVHGGLEGDDVVVPFASLLAGFLPECSFADIWLAQNRAILWDRGEGVVSGECRVETERVSLGGATAMEGREGKRQ